jgi:hypothetical protein
MAAVPTSVIWLRSNVVPPCNVTEHNGQVRGEGYGASQMHCTSFRKRKIRSNILLSTSSLPSPTTPFLASLSFYDPDAFVLQESVRRWEGLRSMTLLFVTFLFVCCVFDDDLSRFRCRPRDLFRGAVVVFVAMYTLQGLTGWCFFNGCNTVRLLYRTCCRLCIKRRSLWRVASCETHNKALVCYFSTGIESQSRVGETETS